MIANNPEKRDADFSWREFFNSHNSELLGAYGNFVNRNLAFISKYFGAGIPRGILDKEIEDKICKIFLSVGEKIERTNLRDALDEIFELIRFGNKYFDSEKSWITRNTDINQCSHTLFNCVQLIANLAILLSPFIPFSSEKVKKWLNISDEWNPQFINVGFEIPEPEILFERLDKSIIDEELKKLHC